MRSKTRSVIRIAALVVVALVIGVGVYQFNATRLTGNAIPMPFGVGASVVLSGSMEPELSRGDLLIVVESESYSADQIVVFQDGSIPVVHRVVSIDGDMVTTKGDANDTPDEPMPIDRVKGKVVLALPLIGYLVNALRTPLGIIIVLVAAVYLMERSFAKDKRAKQEDLRQIREEIERLKNGENTQN